MRGAKKPHHVLLVIVLLSLFLDCSLALYRCDGSPELPLSSRRPVEDRFKLKISGNSHMYVPGEKYSITLQGSRQQLIPEKFIGFALIAEASEPSFSAEQEPNVGNFQLYGDALTKFSERCPHMVIQTNSAPRTEVNIHWTAPPPGSGCIIFRTTVVEQRDLWYMHDGSLSRKICEDVQENLDEQPAVIEKCCACDEAKYELTFEGLWSRHTHPKDFPPNGWLTRFSDVIGASHTVDYRFWEYGGIASEGLREVAERGWTRMLESELKADSENIRTIIKARGISYPNVTGKTFAVFRVDRKHHLMSLVSMIVPSPDWIVGVSGLELCLPNCSWVEFKVLNLKPWDAGTDSGTTYTSPDSPTTPREPIRKITSKYPADASNPFYDDTGEEMKPLAKLYLTRQRLYEKSCSDDAISSDDEDSSQSGDCAVGDWSPWSDCSVTCGKGSRYKQRFYQNQMRAEVALCDRELFIREPCQAPRRCSGDRYFGPFDAESSSPLLNDPRCAVGAWEDWSSCSATCGHAVQTRSRRYLMQGGHKLCGGLPGAPELQQTRPCELDDCEGEDQTEEDENCKMIWSEWSACSATCGRGVKTRTGYVSNGWPGDTSNCKQTTKTEEVDCPAASGCNLSLESAQEICNMPQDPGSCKSNRERFYFDPVTANCRGFIYSGCKGNANNFVTKDDCMNACSVLIDPLKIKDEDDADLDLKGQIPDSLVIDSNASHGNGESGGEDGAGNEDNGPDGAKDCRVSKWSRWSACSVTCGKGLKHKSRHIKSHPRNGGRPCPKLTRSKPCGRTQCDNAVDPEQENGDSGETNPIWGDTVTPSGRQGDCVMGPWTPWSPCSATCGVLASKMRTRPVLVQPTENGQPCGERVQTRSCLLLPCKM